MGDRYGVDTSVGSVTIEGTFLDKRKRGADLRRQAGTLSAVITAEKAAGGVSPASHLHVNGGRSTLRSTGRPHIPNLVWQFCGGSPGKSGHFRVSKRAPMLIKRPSPCRLSTSLLTAWLAREPPSPHSHDGPDHLHHAERPSPLEKPINRSERTCHSEREDEPPAAILQCVAHHHRRDSKQAKERE